VAVNARESVDVGMIPALGKSSPGAIHNPCDVYLVGAAR
jgi:hypothetical protein